MLMFNLSKLQTSWSTHFNHPAP